MKKASLYLVILLFFSFITYGCETEDVPPKDDSNIEDALALEVDLFKTTHNTILTKDIETLHIEDQPLIEAALADYEVLSEEAQAALSDKHAQLELFAEVVAGMIALEGEILRFIMANHLLLSTDVEAIQLSDKVAVQIALSDYGFLSETAQHFLRAEAEYLQRLLERIEVLEDHLNARDAFLDTHEAVLALTEETVRISDKALIETTLDAYDQLDQVIRDLLEEEKTLLEGLLESIAQREADQAAQRQFRDDHQTVLNLIELTVTIEDRNAVETAQSAYHTLSDSVQTLLSDDIALLDALLEQIIALEAEMTLPDEGFDYLPHVQDFSHPYPNTSETMTLLFTEDLFFVYSYQDEYSAKQCFGIEEGQNPVPCQVYGSFSTAQLGRYEIVYYAVDSAGNIASASFYKDVLRDASLLDLSYPIYYRSIEGLYGEELLEALRLLLNSTVRLVNYGEARYILQESDRDPSNPSNVIQLYTGQSVAAAWDLGVTWNREHVWPVSRMPVPRPNNNTIDMSSDLHNLAPEDPDENNFRAAKYFTEHHSANTYHPRNGVKGNVARMIMYMDVMYTELTLVDGFANMANHEMGDLTFLIKWHYQDPVDSFEINRNNVIFNHQRNRNPFIDIPHLVELLWFDHQSIPLP